MTLGLIKITSIHVGFLLGGCLLTLAHCTQAPDEKVLAVINNRNITQHEFEMRWEGLPVTSKIEYEKDGGRMRFLDELITRELLIQEARKQGLDQTVGIREQAQRYREELLLNELLNAQVKSTVTLTKEELNTIYEEHAGELLGPWKVRVWQMLLSSLTAAKDIQDQIHHEKDFAKFAQRHSLDGKTKLKGGDLGPYSKALLSPAIAEIILTLTPGLVSEPIKTDAGYYLMMITPLDAEMIQLDLALQERFRQELLNNKRRLHLDTMIAAIRSKAIVRRAVTLQLP